MLEFSLFTVLGPRARRSSEAAWSSYLPLSHRALHVDVHFILVAQLVRAMIFDSASAQWLPQQLQLSLHSSLSGGFARGGRCERCERCACASPQRPSSELEHLWSDVVTVGVAGASEALYVLIISVDLIFGVLCCAQIRYHGPEKHFGYR